ARQRSCKSPGGDSGIGCRSGSPPYLVSASNSWISNCSFEIDTKYGGLPDRHPVPDRPRGTYATDNATDAPLALRSVTPITANCGGGSLESWRNTLISIETPRPFQQRAQESPVPIVD